MSEDSDEALVQRCRRGDRRAFEALVVRYQRPVYNAALRMLRNPEDARDVAQVTFLKAYERLGDFNPQFRFYSWLYRIALNESINHGKRRRSHEELSGNERDAANGPEQALGLAQLDDALQEAIMSLSEDNRTLIVLHYVLGSSYEDMAVTLDIPAKTVKSRLFSARQKLKDSPLLAAWLERA
ncbi:MAG: RNA polymerase sigma factor [Steroidobacteraceae bacterium]